MRSEPNLTRRGFLQAAATVTTGLVGAHSPASGDESPMQDGTANREPRLYAGRAKALIDVLQGKWFHAQPVPGWGAEQNEWNCHCTLGALIDYSQITGDRAYIDTIRLVAGNKALLASAMNDGVDDMAWAAIAHVKAYRLIHAEDSLSAARQIFATMTHYWDDVCKGGVWWDLKRTYKNAITNELFLVLAGLLYEVTHEPDYLQWTHKEWDWFARSGMINAHDLINDGLRQCVNNGDTTWTYNQGVVLGGLSMLFRFTHERAYLDQATRIAAATIEKLTTTVDNIAILKEPGGVPNSDQQQFKGVFVLYLAQLTRVLPPDSAERKRFSGFILANANALWKHARNDANEINVYWHGGDQAPIYNATTQTAGLDLLNAAAALSR
jgi:predicted alpha-1,6-mannanase (GH76 family)